MTGNPGGRRLKQWLIEQIHSSQYPGLLWEDDSRTMFRIPWKHAGKQDYNQEIDASIFKAWAVFKGKFKEGEKAEPATWKTRLRCALNKSPDFEEVTDRSQLDISEPYKVYRIVPEEEQKTGRTVVTAMNSGCSSDIADMECSSADLEELIKDTASDDYLSSMIKRSHSPEENCRIQPSPEWWSPAPSNGVPTHPETQPTSAFGAAFSQMMICFYYGGKLKGTTLTSHPDGCRISPCPPSSPFSSDILQTVCFPPAELIDGERQRHVTRKLLGHLERGVLLRANREGVFIKRLCQSRVFWSGPGAPYQQRPSKLERDAVVKIFDTGHFRQAVQLYQEHEYPVPDPTITLCFGEEFHDLSMAKSKLIIVQITVVSCQQILDAVNSRRPQYGSPNVDTPDELASDQVARIYQDLCSYNGPQRAPCFRDNVPITA